jgi:hypothetical protein
MATTYKLISSVTLSSSAASMSFTSIPATYTDLKCVISARGATSQEASDVIVAFNGSSSNFTLVRLFSFQSTVYSDTFTSSNFGQQPANAQTANTFGNGEFYIPNYASSNYKSISADSSVETNSISGFEFLGAALWSNAAAITSMTISGNAGNWLQYSTAYLYGISNA